MEYLILIGFVLITITIPASIFLASLTRSSIRETLGRDDATSLGEDIASSAKQVYYLGLYAQKRIVVPIPENVEKLYLLRLEQEGEIYHYVVLRMDDGDRAQNYVVLSSAPLASDTTLPGVEIEDYSADIKECATATCTFTAFTGNTLRPGKKEFLLETVRSGGEVAVNVIPVVE